MGCELEIPPVRYLYTVSCNGYVYYIVSRDKCVRVRVVCVQFFFFFWLLSSVTTIYNNITRRRGYFKNNNNYGNIPDAAADLPVFYTHIILTCDIVEHCTTTIIMIIIISYCAKILINLYYIYTSNRTTKNTTTNNVIYHSE
jgi:hypothetical protein